jgi:hypothetical protein
MKNYRYGIEALDNRIDGGLAWESQSRPGDHLSNPGQVAHYLGIIPSNQNLVFF